MKKIILGILLLLSIGITTATSYTALDLYKIIQPYTLSKNHIAGAFSVDELSNYKSCKVFTKTQNTYQTIYDLGFLKEFGGFFQDGKVFYPYSGYVAHFSALAASAPKNLTQQSIFPYGNHIHAKQGNGTQIFCENENDNFYQMGALRLKGHIVLQDVQLQGIYEDKPVATTARETYFVISELKDSNVKKLPYLKTIGDQMAILLGCFSVNNLSNYFIHKYGDNSYDFFGGLSVNINAVDHSYNVSSVRPFKPLDEIVFKKSATNPEKEITIHAQLTPNVIFSHELDIPCENSWIQDIEILDDAGLSLLAQ